MNVPPLTWLYVPADRPDRVEKALASPRARRDRRSRGRRRARRARPRHGQPAAAARPPPARSGSSSGSTRGDAGRPRGALRGSSRRRRPRAEGRRGPEDVPARRPARPLPDRVGCGRRGGLRDRAHAGVAGISLGEADLRSETGALEAGLDWARGRIVNAAVAAGLPRPPQSVYPHLRRRRGARRARASARAGARTPRPHGDSPDGSCAVIEQAYLPTEEELVRARETVEQLEEALGAATLEGGEFVDAAMLGAARQIARDRRALRHEEVRAPGPSSPPAGRRRDPCRAASRTRARSAVPRR